jgi:hypothetical protein
MLRSTLSTLSPAPWALGGASFRIISSALRLIIGPGAAAN